jgi:hypothetical protein
MTVVHNILVVLNPGHHAEEDELERYSLGQIAEKECAQLEEHLLVCEICRARLEDHDLIAGSMKSAAAQWRAEHPAVERKGWRFPRLILVLASVVLVSAGALWLGRPRALRNSPAVAVTLSTARGASAGEHAPARHPLDLKLDLTGLQPFPHYDLQVVDRLGNLVSNGQTTALTATRISALEPGTYFVRLYSPAGELLREYALQVAN